MRGIRRRQTFSNVEDLREMKLDVERVEYFQIESTKTGKVKDLTKVSTNRIPYTSTAGRSRKAIKMQAKYAHDRPVPKGTSLPGMEDGQEQPYFLPSEKPSNALRAQMDPMSRKTVSEYTRTMESRSARHRRLSRQNAFFKVLDKDLPEAEDLKGYSPSTPEDMRRVSSVRVGGKGDDRNDVTVSNRHQTSTAIGGNNFNEMPVVSTWATAARVLNLEEDILNNNHKPSHDFLSTRNALLKKSMSMAGSDRPSFLNRSNSSGSSFAKPTAKTVSEKINEERPSSGAGTLTPRRSKLTASVSMRTSRDMPLEPKVSQVRRSTERLPVYDKKELETCTEGIDIMLPGTCISPRPPTVRPSTKMRPSRTPTCCSCCSLCDTPKSQLFQTMTPFELQHPELYKRDKAKVLPHCNFCQADEMKKNLVQYCHGDVIKTFDWLMKDAKETPL